MSIEDLFPPRTGKALTPREIVDATLAIIETVQQPPSPETCAALDAILADARKRLEHRTQEVKPRRKKHKKR